MRVPVSPSHILIPVRVYVLVPSFRSDCYACSCFTKSDLTPIRVPLPHVISYFHACFCFPKSDFFPVRVPVPYSHACSSFLRSDHIPMRVPVLPSYIIFPYLFLFPPVIPYSHACSCFPKLYHIPIPSSSYHLNSKLRSWFQKPFCPYNKSVWH